MFREGKIQIAVQSSKLSIAPQDGTSVPFLEKLMRFLQALLQKGFGAFWIAFVRNICFNFVLWHRMIIVIKTDHFVEIFGSYLKNPRTGTQMCAFVYV